MTLKAKYYQADLAYGHCCLKEVVKNLDVSVLLCLTLEGS